MNVVDLLKKDHQTVSELFSQFEQASGSEQKRKIVDEIVRELSVHADIEEEVFYPAVKAALAERGDELVSESLQEHRDMKRILAQLDTASPDETGFEANVMRLKQDVERHVQEEEEEEVMPELSRKVNKALLDDLGQEAEQARRRAPTRPHPHTPEQPPGVKVSEQERRSAQAEHDDVRLEELRQKYGELAELTVDQLEERPREQGIKAPSGKRKEELLQALTGRG